MDSRATARSRTWAGSIALSTLTALALASAAQAADEIHWTVKGQTAVTFDWRGSSSENTVRYGLTSGTYTSTVTAGTPSPVPTSSSGPFWEAKITGLLENTLYYYKIGSAAEHTFRTPPPRGSSDYWFGEEADIGSTLGWTNVGTTQGMILVDNPNITGDDRPRFIIAPGDLTYGDQETLADVDQHFNDVMPWSQDIAYMPAWGNHEWATASDGMADNLNNYEGRFDFPNSQTSPGATDAVGNGPGEDWYWFDYGNVRFISFPEPMTGAWEDWVNSVQPAMQAAQNDPAIQFIIAYGHRPAWSSGADHGGDSQLAGYFATLHGKFSKFNLVIQGHSHHYERSIPSQTNGILFIIGPGGGSSLAGLASGQPSWSAYRLDHLEHIRLHVTQNRIDGYTVCGPNGSGNTGSCTQGTVVDTWTVNAAVTSSQDLIAPAAVHDLGP
jgi:calcineurin-like phosphoesterase family protein/purple acid phosphatase-like protein